MSACEAVTIPVKPEPSPSKDPLIVPLTNKLPVKLVLPLTLKAIASLPVNINDPEISAEPVYGKGTSPEVPDVPDVPTFPVLENPITYLSALLGKVPVT